MLRVPQFGGHEEVLALHQAAGEGLRKHGADLGLVPINGRAVDVAVAALERRLDGGADLAGRRLPRAQADDGHGLAGVERQGGVLGHGVCCLLSSTAWARDSALAVCWLIELRAGVKSFCFAETLSTQRRSATVNAAVLAIRVARETRPEAIFQLIFPISYYKVFHLLRHS